MIFNFKKFKLKRDEMLNLFIEILQKRAPEIINTQIKEGIFDLSEDLAAKICEELMDEFCETGLQPNSEPNERGLKIEDLIDFFNPAFWKD